MEIKRVDLMRAAKEQSSVSYPVKSERDIDTLRQKARKVAKVMGYSFQVFKISDEGIAKVVFKRV